METEKPYKVPTSPPESKPSSPPPPPSITSSPTHDFSFTISLHPPTPLSSNPTATLKLTESAAPTPDFDLAPADNIFFHGHLLPLHFLSHRPSNASTETEKTKSTKPIDAGTASAADKKDDGIKESTKAKSFSSLFPLRKWLRGIKDRDAEKQGRKKTKKAFEVGRLWKKYASLVERILISKEAKEKRELRQSPCSFSGNCNPRDGVWRREFSAPVSMRTSPANSGLLVAPPSVFSSSDESSMEELQNAIQAAIAHCKNSVVIKH